MYEFHRGDIATVDKYMKKTDSRSRQAGSDASAEKSTHSLKAGQLSENSDDVNPKLSVHDTPVSGVKVLKPGSRKKAAAQSLSPAHASGANMMSVTSIPIKRETIQDSYADQEKLDYLPFHHTETRSRKSFEIPENKKIRERRTEPADEEIKIQDRQSFPTLATNDRYIGNLVKGARGASRSIDARRQARLGIEKNTSFDLTKSREKFKDHSADAISRASRDNIRQDSIRRIKQLNQTNQPKSTHHSFTKEDLEDKFGYVREKFRKGSSAKKYSEKKDREDSTVRDKRMAPQDYFRDGEFQQKHAIDIKIDPIAPQRMVLLHEWLKELGYMKYFNTEKTFELPDECRNGSLLFKLINHLERTQVLKGENTSSPTAIKVNLDKVFTHLKKYEKFNPRYQSSEYYIMNGNWDVFWGLIDDIRHVYGNKISRQDTRFKRSQGTELKKLQNNNQEEWSHEKSALSYSVSPGISKKSLTKNQTVKNKHVESEQSIFTTKQLALSRGRHLQSGENSRYSNAKKHQISQEDKQGSSATLKHCTLPAEKAGSLKVSTNTRFVDLDNTTNKQLKKVRMDPNNLADLETDCRHWFESLGLRVVTKDNVFENQLRNGYLLCLVAAKVFSRSLKGVCKEPKCIQECRNNVESALNILRSERAGIPYELLWQSDEVIKGNPSVIWQLFSSLKYIHESNLASGPETNISRGANLSSVNLCTLPYTESQLESLCESLVSWVVSLGVCNQDLRLPRCIEEVIDQVSKGAILAKMIFRITGKVLRGIHQKPVCRPNYTHNVRKCLDHLLTVPQMSRKFLWRVEDIVDCQKLQIIGLLEDMHRLADGLPRRRDPDYFEDGPYIVAVKREAALFGIDAEIFKTQGSAGTKAKESAMVSPVGEKVKLNRFKIADSRDAGLAAELDNKTLIDLINSKPVDRSGAVGISGEPRTLGELMQARPEAFDLNALENTFGRQRSDEEDGKYRESVGVEFSRVKRVVKLLLLMNMPKVIEREMWESGVWTQFSDGLVIAKIIEKLEMKEVHGLNKTPRTAASCLNNLRRCLTILRENKKTDQYKLHCEQGLLEGNPQAVCDVVEQIVQGYSVSLGKLETQPQSQQGQDPEDRYPRITDQYVLNREERKEHILPPSKAF